MPGHHVLLSGFSWSPAPATPRAVTFAFAADEGPAFAPAQKASVRAALRLWDDASGLSFVEVPDAPGGLGSDIRFRFDSLPLGTFGFGHFPGDASGAGDVVLNQRMLRNDPLAPHPARLSFEVLLHEIGHALGLGHAPEGVAGALTVMAPAAGARLPTNALGAWDVAAARALYGTPEDESALGLAWRWDEAERAVRGEGTAWDDLLLGTPHRDRLLGGDGSDTLLGGAGDDLLAPGPGEGDAASGGPGLDTLLLPGALRRGTELDLAAGTLRWAEGSLRFDGVERIAFADGTLVLAGEDAAARIVQQAYRDILRREPDPTGLGHWAERVAEGMGEAELRARIRASDEYLAGVADRPPPADPAGPAGALWVPDFESLIVARFYHLALGRRPEEAGLRHWVARLEGGESLEEAAWGFLQSPEARARGGAPPFATAEALVTAAHDEARIAPLAPWTDAGIALA